MITQNPLHRKTVEGKEGYGCWYNRATGSGIWLNVGRTFVLDGDDAPIAWKERGMDPVLIERESGGRIPTLLSTNTRRAWV